MVLEFDHQVIGSAVAGWGFIGGMVVFVVGGILGNTADKKGSVTWSHIGGVITILGFVAFVVGAVSMVVVGIKYANNMSTWENALEERYGISVMSTDENTFVGKKDDEIVKCVFVDDKEIGTREVVCDG